GSCARPRQSGQRGGGGCLFRHETQRQPDRRLGVAAVARHGGTLRSGEEHRALRCQICPLDCPAATILVRLSYPSADHRILARSSVSLARANLLPPRRSFPALDHRPPVSIAHCQWLRGSSLALGHSQLLAPHLRGNLRHGAFGQVTQVKGSETDADQPSDFESEIFHHPLDFTILAFMQADNRPGVRAPCSFEFCLYWLVPHTI